MDILITKCLHVPTLLKDENPVEVIETLTMVAPQGRGDHSNRGGHGGCPHCTYCKRMAHNRKSCYSLYGSLHKATHVSKFEKGESKSFDEEYQEYLGLNLKNLTITVNLPPYQLFQ